MPHSLLKGGMVLPAYDQCIKASHLFNLLDARGVISVTERQAYILRIRELAKTLRRGLARDGAAVPAAWQYGETADAASDRAPLGGDTCPMQERAAEDFRKLMTEGWSRQAFDHLRGHAPS